jgi:putative membrane protein
MYILLHLAALTVTVLALERLLPAVRVKSIGSAVVVAIVFSVLNFFFGWLIKVALFIPAILTLGLLFLVMNWIVNTILLWLTDKLIGSFAIETTGALLVSSAVITVVNSVFYMALRAQHLGLYHGPSGPIRWI